MEDTRRKSTSVRQLDLLITFMEAHTNFAVGQLRSKEGRALATRLWVLCAEILNSEGVARTPKDWSKAWNDYKCRVRAKLAEINRGHRGTGGGPCRAPQLSLLEERVAALIGRDVGPLTGVRQDPEIEIESTPPPLVDWSYVPTLVLAVILVLVAATALAARAADGKQSTRLPGPQALPFLGTRWLFWSRYKMNKLHEAYEDMFRRYGPVFVETTPGGASVVSIAERAALEAVLRAPAKRPYRPPTEIVQVYRRSRPDRYASTGIVNEQGEKWHHLRRHLTAELTSPNTMQGFLPELNNTCDDFIVLLDSCRRSDGTVAAFDQLTNRMGLESVCALMLGSRLGFLERWMSGRAATLAAAVKAHFRAQRDSYYGAPLWKFAPTTLYRTFVKSEETIHTIVSELMEEARNRRQGTADDDAMQEIFLRILENPALDMRDKKAAVIDFITAGIETLANSLVFLLYLLSGRPDWQRTIRSELPSCSSLTAEDLAAAPSVRAAIYEAFRLLPTAPFLARLLDAPMTIAGHKLPAGTFILAHTGAACRREENFWRAREFIPERWVKPIAPHAATLVAPFGRGRRMCPGKRFVDLELHLLLAKIMQRWRVEFDGELDIQFDFLLAPKSPVSLRLVEW